MSELVDYTGRKVRINDDTDSAWAGEVGIVIETDEADEDYPYVIRFERIGTDAVFTDSFSREEFTVL
jgi:Photosystem I reaction centre subunit IV / PsaE